MYTMTIYIYDQPHSRGHWNNMLGYVNALRCSRSSSNPQKPPSQNGLITQTHIHRKNYLTKLGCVNRMFRIKHATAFNFFAKQNYMNPICLLLFIVKLPIPFMAIRFMFLDHYIKYDSGRCSAAAAWPGYRDGRWWWCWSCDHYYYYYDATASGALVVAPLIRATLWI